MQAETVGFRTAKCWPCHCGKPVRQHVLEVQSYVWNLETITRSPSVDEDKWAYILQDKVRALVGHFCNDYLKANPKS